MKEKNSCLEPSGTSQMREPDFVVEVEGGKTNLLFSFSRGVLAALVLICSLAVYLIGIILTLTIIGAIAGIPLILATYGVDAVALVVLINLREKIYRIVCPKCFRKRIILPAVKDNFLCKGCGSYIFVETV